MTRPFVAILLAALWAPPVPAADLTIFVAGEAEYDDNAFRRQTDEEDDVFFRIRPGVKIHEDRGDDVNFSLQYEVPAEFAVDNSEELNDVDHVADGDATWHVNDRLDVTASERFRYLRSTLRRDFGDDSVEAGAGIPTISDERERVKRNDATLGATYRFAPRLFGQISGSHGWFDSTREDRSEVNTVSGSGRLVYALTSEHQVGGGAAFTYQKFDEHVSFTGSDTYIYNVFANWRWTIDETTAFEVTAGPSLIDSRQDTPGALTFRQQAPFTISEGGVAPVGFVDVEGNSIANQPITPGSLILQNPNACPTLGGVAVQPCGSNIVVDPQAGPDSVQLRQAILDAVIPVTNLNPRSSSETDLTIFAEVVLTKQWLPELQSALSYTREQGGASGLGGTVITDSVSLSNTWDFAERWQLSLRGGWTRRESATEQVGTFFRTVPTDPATIPGAPAGSYVFIAGLDGTAFNASVDDVTIDTQRWGVGGRLTHRLFRNTRVYAQVTYDDQESKARTRGATSDFDNFIATVGVRHVFEPIKLW